MRYVDQIAYLITEDPDVINEIYALRKYKYKGYIVEKEMTSGLPPHSSSYWVVIHKADQWSKEPELPIDKLPKHELHELNHIIKRYAERDIELMKRVNAQARHREIDRREIDDYEI